MKRAGTWLLLGSIGFWLAWLLMPGVGVTDTDTIFALVGRHRGEVIASVILQLGSAAAYVLGALAIDARGSRALRAGAALLAVGALGSAADAIFHVVAVEMTAPGTSLAAMAPVMRALQGPDLWLLAPFILAFLAAHVTLAWARRRVAPWAWRLVLALPAVAAAGAVARGTGLVSGRIVGLAVLAVVSGSLALVGASFASSRQ